jgi:hypothetical protein
MTAPQPDPVVAGLQLVLAAQHAAVYGYPVIGVHLDDDSQLARARTMLDAHRLARDALAGQLAALGATPVPSEAAYLSPAPVTSATTALGWAVMLEEQLGVGYRFLLLGAVRAAGPQTAIRRQGVTGLGTAAAAATSWRSIIAPAHPTVAFPGTG